jgi:hypothetical protein
MTGMITDINSEDRLVRTPHSVRDILLPCLMSGEISV